MKWVAAGLCGFEVAAICTGKVPTLTALSAKHRWLGPVLVGALAIHLWHSPRIKAELNCSLCLDPLGDES